MKLWTWLAFAQAMTALVAVLVVKDDLTRTVLTTLCVLASPRALKLSRTLA